MATYPVATFNLYATRFAIATIAIAIDNYAGIYELNKRLTFTKRMWDAEHSQVHRRYKVAQ
ncbi:hypothetical protein HanRHA438_Chr14g0645981 [Helianthus annuus]|nr:hypothetical protein HanRHA438_Chr14g0645981 [Helianthus annuus]